MIFSTMSCSISNSELTVDVNLRGHDCFVNALLYCMSLIIFDVIYYRQWGKFQKGSSICQGVVVKGYGVWGENLIPIVTVAY